MVIRILSALLLVAATCCVSGCVSKSKAQAQARAAYLAGQRDAIAQMNPHQTGSTNELEAPADVTFIGPVETPKVPWTEGLTLAKAILQAVYKSQIDPTMILIIRPNEQIQIDPARLLSGNDYPLKPGDVVQFQMPQQ
jgi:hypothetical protein